MYDPTVGRWTTQDPEGFDAGDSNLDRYVGNGPTDGTDPTGLFDTKTVFANLDDDAKDRIKRLEGQGWRYVTWLPADGTGAPDVSPILTQEDTISLKFKVDYGYDAEDTKQPLRRARPLTARELGLRRVFTAARLGLILERPA